MEFYPDISQQNAALSNHERIALRYFEQVMQQGKQSSEIMLNHRDLINKVYQYGFSNI